MNFKYWTFLVSQLTALLSEESSVLTVHLNHELAKHSTGACSISPLHNDIITIIFLAITRDKLPNKTITFNI